MDEEDIEYFEEDIRKVDKIENFVMEISGIILQVYGEHVSEPIKQHLLPHFAPTLFHVQGKRDYEICKKLYSHSSMFSECCMLLLRCP